MPSRSSERAALSGVRSMRTPSDSSTSALPVRLETARLPCLATATPHEAVDDRDRGRDVERAGVVAAGAAGVDQRAARGCGSAARARASPRPCRRSRRASRPSCAARPRAPRSARAWPRRPGSAPWWRAPARAVRSSRCDGAARSRSGSRGARSVCWRHSVRKFSISLRPGRGQHRLGVELHAPGLVVLVLEPHDLALRRPGHDLEHRRAATRARRSASGSASPRTDCRARRTGRGPCAGSGWSCRA